MRECIAFVGHLISTDNKNNRSKRKATPAQWDCEGIYSTTQAKGEKRGKRVIELLCAHYACVRAITTITIEGVQA